MTIIERAAWIVFGAVLVLAALATIASVVIYVWRDSIV